MLVSINEAEERVPAHLARREDKYCCPSCGHPTTLKRGMIVTPHFAHKAKSECTHGAGETEEHRRSKQQFFDELKKRNISVDMEKKISNTNRCADISIFRRTTPGAIFEFQRSKITLKEIHERTLDYCRTENCLVWISLICKNELLQNCERPRIIQKYSIPQFERYAADHAGFLYTYDPAARVLLKFRSKPTILIKTESEFFDVDTQQMEYYGGNAYPSKQFVELELMDSISIKSLRFKGKGLPRKQTKYFKLPKRRVIEFFSDDEL